eukprot:9730736-Alexandrium_andersonii.AAC.1
MLLLPPSRLGAARRITKCRAPEPRLLARHPATTSKRSMDGGPAAASHTSGEQPPQLLARLRLHVVYNRVPPSPGGYLPH